MPFREVKAVYSDHLTKPVNRPTTCE